MTTFDEREQAFENKFAYDAEMQFRASSRRVNTLGFWAARRFGLKEEEAVDYTRSLLAHWLSQPGSDHVVERILADAKERGEAMTAEEVRREADRLLAEAKADLIGPPE